ncbi:MAG TPA: hypothetical protein VEP66_15765 [Myxococcales bacterium]|nr:hypothetical protein [Myxococcales bacterium]
MYAASDDLKVVDGKTVIYLNLARNEKAPPGDRPSSERPETATLPELLHPHTGRILKVPASALGH